MTAIKLSTLGASGAPAPAASILLNVTQTTASSGSITQAIPAGTYIVESEYPCQLTINSVVFQIPAMTPTPITVASNATSYSVVNLSLGLNWVNKALPNGTGFTAVAYGGGVFCAVLSGTAIAATSPDGITWTQRTLPSSTAWNAIAWNGTVFCAISNASGTIAATSPDGITWTARTLSATSTWSAIAWNGTVFVVVNNAAANTVSMTSPDGITWTSRTITSGVWQTVVWNGTIFLAIQNSSTTACTSPDGITWTSRTLALAPNSPYNIAWGAGIFVINAGATNYQTSPDGITWTSRRSPSSVQIQIIYFVQGLFVIMLEPTTGYSSSQQNIFVWLTSPDGITWTRRTNLMPVLLYSAEYLSSQTNNSIAIGGNTVVLISAVYNDTINYQALVSQLLPNPLGIYSPPTVTI